MQALEDMIAAFDRVIAAGDWDSSLFLRNTVKPLEDMREEARQLREQLMGNVTSENGQRAGIGGGHDKGIYRDFSV